MRPRSVTLPLAILALLFPACRTQAMNLVRAATRSDSARIVFGVSGKGVIVAILDRGIDWHSNDFRNPDGTTRIQYIFDLTDNTGAHFPNNPYGVGTIYGKSTIDSALRSQIPALATRDAVGHGTVTAGIACGNGRSGAGGKYRGIAPSADLIVVKVVSDGAPAHDSQPAEAPFNDSGVYPTAIDFVNDKAASMGEPCVMLLNLGSQNGPTDGSSDLCRKIDSVAAAGIPGRIFVTGTGDDGGMHNRAGGSLAQGETHAIQIHKGSAGPLFVDLWYGSGDRFDVSIQTPSGSYGPYASPAGDFDSDVQATPDFLYYQLGSGVLFYGSNNGKREIYVRLDGPTGDYQLELTGASVTDGRFDATMNPSQFWNPLHDSNQFLSDVAPGSIWDGASAFNNITPNCYDIRTSWTDIDGFTRSLVGQGAVGNLWPGSSVGPTFDGRYGVDVSAPGEDVMASYSPTSYWATFRSNLVNDGGGLYGTGGAVSAASPIVTGILALMLERNHALDAPTARQMLRESARADGATGVVPNNSWGYGKVDAFGAVARAVYAVGIGSGAPEESHLRWLELPVSPFRRSTTISWSVPRAGRTDLAIYDVSGRRVAGLVSAPQAAGPHQREWTPLQLPSGVYFARLQGGREILVRRLLYFRP